jgi:hypothetical protein
MSLKGDILTCSEIDSHDANAVSLMRLRVTGSVLLHPAPDR